MRYSTIGAVLLASACAGKINPTSRDLMDTANRYNFNMPVSSQSTMNECKVGDNYIMTGWLGPSGRVLLMSYGGDRKEEISAYFVTAQEGTKPGFSIQYIPYKDGMDERKKFSLYDDENIDNIIDSYTGPETEWKEVDVKKLGLALQKKVHRNFEIYKRKLNDAANECMEAKK